MTEQKRKRLYYRIKTFHIDNENEINEFLKFCREEYGDISPKIRVGAERVVIIYELPVYT